MRRCTGSILITGLLCLIFCSNAFSQPDKADSSSQQNALNNTLSFYYSTIGKQSPLYNGIEYFLRDPAIKGNAYFSDVNAFTAGALVYDGFPFKNVPMLYDIYSDQVVVLLYNHFSMFSLIKDKVTSFDFLNQHFIRIDSATSLANPVISPGFYNEIYNGKIEVLVKWQKNIQTSSTGQSSESYFNQYKDYFIKKDNKYVSFSGQGGLLDVLKDKKRDLQRYIRENRIKFRAAPEEAMVKIASYYDHLTN
jgi:hypothetical protein